MKFDDLSPADQAAVRGATTARPAKDRRTAQGPSQALTCWTCHQVIESPGESALRTHQKGCKGTRFQHDFEPEDLELLA